METSSVSLVNVAIGGILIPLTFDYFGIEGEDHLRWCAWFWNKISDRRESHCLRRLGILISNAHDWQDLRRCCCWLTVYLVDTVSVTYLFAKVKPFWDFLLRLERYALVSIESLRLVFRRRRTVSSYNTGIFDKNLSPVRE